MARKKKGFTYLTKEQLEYKKQLQSGELPPLLAMAGKAPQEDSGREREHRMNVAEIQGREVIKKHPRADMTSEEFITLLEMKQDDAIVRAFYMGVGIGARQK